MPTEEYRELFKINYDVPFLRNLSRNIDKYGKVIFIEDAIYRSDKYILEVNISRREGRIR